jgi:hypothetical protein
MNNPKALIRIREKYIELIYDSGVRNTLSTMSLLLPKAVNMVFTTTPPINCTVDPG